MPREEVAQRMISDAEAKEDLSRAGAKRMRRGMGEVMDLETFHRWTG